MTDTLMPRLKNLLANDRPDVVIIALGINDCTLARPYNEILHAYEEAIELLNEEEIPVMIGTIDAYAVRTTTSLPAHFINFKQVIYGTLEAKYPDVIFFPFLSKELTTNPIYRIVDNIHINDKGHRVIADEIKPSLIALILKKRDLMEESNHP